LKIHTRAVHAGDRKPAGAHVASTTPIHTATSYFYPTMAQLESVFAEESKGYCYSRYDNPSAAALEELMCSLEGGQSALACASGMAALHTAILTALTDRRRSIVAAHALYGQTVSLLMNVLEPAGIAVRFADVCDPAAFRSAVEEARPGCILMETISNPLVRVGPLDSIAAMAAEAGAALVVDNTFATPLLELGAAFTVHSLSKYLAGHGDVLGGVVVTNAAHAATLRALGRNVGPTLGPFECYLAMRGIKTFPLRMERQCANAAAVAARLAQHPRVERVYFGGNPSHPDAATIQRLFPAGLYGAIVAFDLRGAATAEVFRFMDALKMIVRATSLGDVHSMMLYPAMSSHRELSPKHRQRLGIGGNLVRLSVGIEDPEDICADLEQGLAR